MSQEPGAVMDSMRVATCGGGLEVLPGQRITLLRGSREAVRWGNDPTKFLRQVCCGLLKRSQQGATYISDSKQAGQSVFC
jgi:hypothetical protein